MKHPATDTVHIILTTDDNYAPHCGVTIASVLHNNEQADIHFHILGLSISQDSKNKTKELVAMYHKKVSFYEVDDNIVSDMPNLSEDTHIRPASYIRLFLAQLLPSDIDKILYLDCDLIVRHSFDELWRTNIEDAALAAVENLLNIQNTPALVRYDYERYSYFNSGVMLINLKYWRENNLTEKFNDFINKNHDAISYHDQDVLNGVLFDKKILVPHTWNMLNYYLNKKIFAWKPEIYENYGKDPNIAHFTSAIKPWNTIKYCAFFDEYHKYRKLTPWKSDKQMYKELRRSAKTKHIISNWLGIDKLLFNIKMKQARDKAIKRK